jgi:hypothetical protein
VVFCPQITLGDEVARAGIAARVFHDVGQAVLEPAVPARPLDSRLDPCIGLATGLAATGRPAHERRRRIEIGVVVALRLVPSTAKADQANMVKTIATRLMRMANLL